MMLTLILIASALHCMVISLLVSTACCSFTKLLIFLLGISISASNDNDIAMTISTAMGDDISKQRKVGGSALFFEDAAREEDK